MKKAKNTMKRLLTMGLAVVLLTGSAPMTAFAEEADKTEETGTEEVVMEEPVSDDLSYDQEENLGLIDGKYIYKETYGGINLPCGNACA